MKTVLIIIVVAVVLIRFVIYFIMHLKEIKSENELQDILQKAYGKKHKEWKESHEKKDEEKL